MDDQLPLWPPPLSKGPLPARSEAKPLKTLGAFWYAPSEAELPPSSAAPRAAAAWKNPKAAAKGAGAFADMAATASLAFESDAAFPLAGGGDEDVKAAAAAFETAEPPAPFDPAPGAEVEESPPLWKSSRAAVFSKAAASAFGNTLVSRPSIATSTSFSLTPCAAAEDSESTDST